MAARQLDGEGTGRRSLGNEAACRKAAARSLADHGLYGRGWRLFKWVGLALAFLLAAPAVASEKTGWACTERLEHLQRSRFAHVELTQPEELPGYGWVYISLPDVKRLAWVKISGLEVRWDWDDPGSEDAPGYRYSFVIKPSGEGLFFDFKFGEGEEGSRTASARQRYVCRRSQVNLTAK